jgi:hypothetical protein
LEKRKNLLEDIASHQRDAKQSGLTKQQSEIDKINEKYDELIKNIDAFNKKTDEFNRKNPKNQVNKIGQLDIQALNKARQIEITNSNFKQDAENFKANLEQKQKLFEEFENSKKEIGEQKAVELFSDQLEGYRSFLKLLQDESDKLAPKIAFGVANVGEVEKFKALIATIKALQQKQAEDQLETDKKNFSELLNATVTFNVAKAAINKKYDDLEATLAKDTTLTNKDERKKILEDGRKQELDDLNNQLIRESDLYKKLNQDIIGFTRDRIKEEIKALQVKLKTDTTLTPQQKADIQNTIDQYKGLLDSTNQLSKDFSKISSTLSSVSGDLNAAADAVEGLNTDLADTIRQMADIINIAGQAASAIASFATGDIVSGIGSTVNAISGIIQGFAKAAQSKKMHNKPC